MHLFNKRITSLILFAVITFFASQAYCEGNTNRTLSDQHWHELTNDSAFSYKDKKEKADTIQRTTKPNIIEKALDGLINFFSSTVGQFIFWGAILLFVAYVAYKMLRNERLFLFRRDKKRLSGDIELAEEDMSIADWEEHMQRAIKAGDMRHAIRYSYMWLLQLLQNKELIQYRNDKTNYDYYSELIATSYKQPFKQLLRQYEYTWYGHFAISEAAYDDYMQLFNTLKKQLA